jgi:hypothetical protein
MSKEALDVRRRLFESRRVREGIVERFSVAIGPASIARVAARSGSMALQSEIGGREPSIGADANGPEADIYQSWISFRALFVFWSPRPQDQGRVHVVGFS